MADRTGNQTERLQRAYRQRRWRSRAGNLTIEGLPEVPGRALPDENLTERAQGKRPSRRRSGLPVAGAPGPTPLSVMGFVIFLARFGWVGLGIIGLLILAVTVFAAAQIINTFQGSNPAIPFFVSVSLFLCGLALAMVLSRLVLISRQTR